MIKQDKKTSTIFGIELKTPRRYLPDRLIAFLNLNPENTQEVKDFCRKYEVVPFGALANWYQTITSEQKLLKEVVTKVINNQLSDSDLALINSKLEGIHPAVKLMTSEEVIKVNETLPGLEGAPIKNNKQFLIKTSKHSNSLVSLWEDFISYMNSMQPLKSCARCGKLFSPAQRTGEKQRFCTDTCRYNYHDTKEYHEHKKK